MDKRLLIIIGLISALIILIECCGLYNLYRSWWDGYDFDSTFYAASIILDDQIMEVDPDDGR